MNMKKIIFGLCILLLIAGSIWWSESTRDRRKADAEYETLVRIAERQAVEIAIIEQASKLSNYKQQIAEQTKVADPKDVEIK